MLLFGVEFQGITSADMEASAKELRPALRRGMRSALQTGKTMMVKAASGGVLKARSGFISAARRGRPSTVQLIRQGKMKIDFTATGMVGRFITQAKLLNIHEGGANIPAVTVKAKRDASPVLRFQVGGRAVFAGQVQLPARRIPARPIRRPIERLVGTIAQFRLSQIAVGVIQRQKAAESDAIAE